MINKNFLFNFTLVVKLATPTKMTLDTSTPPRQNLSTHEKSAQRRASLGTQVILQKISFLFHLLEIFYFMYVYDFCCPVTQHFVNILLRLKKFKRELFEKGEKQTAIIVKY